MGLLRGAQCPVCGSHSTFTTADGVKAAFILGISLSCTIILAPIGFVIILLGIILAIVKRDPKGTTNFTCKDCKHTWTIRR